MNVPEKCIKCVHHKKSDFETEYCDYTEYLDKLGCPVPYPYFFKQDYPCKGHEDSRAGCGYGRPRQYDGKCEGYGTDYANDEPCEICKRCRLHYLNAESENWRK